jgi:nucleoside-diphosphate-sugar epimerase
MSSPRAAREKRASSIPEKTSSTGTEARIRASIPSILKKRSRGCSTILVTGGTGFLGSHLAVELLRRGHCVFLLARRESRLSAQARVERLLEWFGVDRPDGSRLRVFEGHLDEAGLGLDRADYEDLASSIDEIVHCASSTSFSEKKREDVEHANVANLENVLTLAARSRCSYFHHVSTAYVAGKKTGPCAEELVETGEFTNVYEETKYLGERSVSAICAREGIRLNIYRPSIVYGSSLNGRTIRFDAVYYPVRTVLFFKNVYEKDLREHGGKKAREMGVALGADGRMHLPLRVEATTAGGINLIPIDHFVGAFMAIMDDCLDGGVFHIVNERLTTIEALSDYTMRFFDIEGVRAVPPQAFIEVPRNGLEILFEHYVEAYGAYMKDTRVFENGKTREILRRRGITCPDFDYALFSICMRYAVEVDWGARLFDQAR